MELNQIQNRPGHHNIGVLPRYVRLFYRLQSRGDNTFGSRVRLCVHLCVRPFVCALLFEKDTWSNKLNMVSPSQCAIIGREFCCYSRPSVIRNSFIQKPCYADRIFRNGSLSVGNTLVFPEISFLDPELNFLDKIYDFLYKFPLLSGNQKTRLSNFPDFLLPTIV